MEASPHAAPSRRWLQATVFVTGMCIMAIEMSSSRLIAPWFGTSLIVWTVIIGVIMAALSVGYWAGGRLSDRRPEPELLYRIIAGAGALVLVIPFVAGPVMGLSATGAVSVLFGSLGAVIVLFALPIGLLGMVSPFVIRLASLKVEEVGDTAGSIYAVSTVGSLVGTFLPALATIPFLGTRRTILFFAALLVVTGVLGMRRFGRARGGVGRAALMLAAVVALGAAALGPSGLLKASRAPGREVVYEGESLYNFIQVQDRSVAQESGGTRKRRVLLLNEGYAVHSVYDPEGPYYPFVGSVWDYFGLCAIPVTGVRTGPVDVCLVGLAAGSIAKEMFVHFGAALDVRVDGVEIDGQIIEVGRRFFGMNEPGLNAIEEDGRSFLLRTERRYDLILTDAYRQPYIPFQLTTREYFELCRARLKPGGVVGLNIGAMSEDSPLFRRVVGTIAAVFADVRFVPVSFAGALFNNYVVLASDRPLEAAQLDPATNPLLAGPLRGPAGEFAEQVLRNARYGWTAFERRAEDLPLTDDLAPVEYFTDKMIVEYLLSGDVSGAVQQETGGVRRGAGTVRGGPAGS